MNTESRTALTAHTPGPWVPDEQSDNAIDVMAGEQTVAMVMALRDDQLADDDRANARLIAAAPDLLAALYKIAQGGNTVRADWPASQAIDRETMCDIARAAITKATGAAP